jgi:hypothetical protein
VILLHPAVSALTRTHHVSFSHFLKLTMPRDTKPDCKARQENSHSYFIELSLLQHGYLLFDPVSVVVRVAP